MNLLQQSCSRRTFFGRAGQLSAFLALWPLHQTTAAPQDDQQAILRSNVDGYGEGAYGEGAYPAPMGQIESNEHQQHTQATSSIYLPIVTKGE